jgi:hypothetical protein
MSADFFSSNDRIVHASVDCAADLLVLAERELAAFHRSVITHYGPSEAQLAIEDWLNELERAAIFRDVQIQDWRAFTICAVQN